MAYPTFLSPPKTGVEIQVDLIVGHSCHYTVVQVILHWVKRRAFQEKWHQVLKHTFFSVY